MPISECWKNTGKAPIGTRWIDVNKGDDQYPDYRSRLVAQEIKRDRRDDLFAATPPLEAKKILFALAVTAGIGFKGATDQEAIVWISSTYAGLTFTLVPAVRCMSASRLRTENPVCAVVS